MARTVVGLDIGGSGVRAAEIVPGRRPSLRRYASVALTEGVISSGLVVDPDALTAALRKLWVQGRFSTKDVTVGLANNGVLVRQMDLDWMPAEDFRKALRYQVADALPVPVDEANLDYYLLDEIEPDPENPQQQRKIARVMLVAAGREMVDTFVHSIQAAGLSPVRVDLLPFALVRAVSPIIDPLSPLEAIVDIGADTVVVVVHQGGRPRFVRTLAGHGGHAMTQALMDRYEWTWEEAERTKITVGLVDREPLAEPTGSESFLDDLTDTTIQPRVRRQDHPAQTVIGEQVASLVAELGATLDYFTSSAGTDGTLARLLLTGLAADLGGLDEMLERQLEVPVEHLSVMSRLRKPRRMVLLPEEEDALTVPAGLCLLAAS
jgi:type IV pilus assembly protein PilM